MKTGSFLWNRIHSWISIYFSLWICPKFPEHFLSGGIQNSHSRGLVLRGRISGDIKSIPS